MSRVSRLSRCPKGETPETPETHEFEKVWYNQKSMYICSMMM